jgi:hypothetical protein
MVLTPFDVLDPEPVAPERLQRTGFGDSATDDGVVGEATAPILTRNAALVPVACTVVPRVGRQCRENTTDRVDGIKA